MERRADRVDAAIWALVGAVILIASLRIDRLENLGINPWSMPGLMPAVVGTLMLVVAGAMAWRTFGVDDAVDSVHAPVADGVDAPDADGGGRSGLRPALLAGSLCVAFAGIALGHDLPFALEAAVFVFLFITLFSWAEWRAADRLVKGLATAGVIALVSTGAIAWLFESVFLVRLP